MAGFWLIPDMPKALDPREASRIWELTSEIAVIVALFGTGIRIDNLASYRRWRPTIRLLVLAMPLTIAGVAFLGYAFAGMTLAGAILLGAVLAPTDPVLAEDVQVGSPTEGGEHPVRFALTTEAGLNDGLAFPFVYLGLIVGSAAFSATSLLTEWLLHDVGALSHHHSDPRSVSRSCANGGLDPATDKTAFSCGISFQDKHASDFEPHDELTPKTRYPKLRAAEQDATAQFLARPRRVPVRYLLQIPVSELIRVKQALRNLNAPLGKIPHDGVPPNITSKLHARAESGSPSQRPWHNVAPLNHRSGKQCC
jgi:hypothetical protein